MAGGWGIGCTVHSPGPLGGRENWLSHELCMSGVSRPGGVGRGLAGGTVIQRFPELGQRRLVGGGWGSDVAAEGASPNRILDKNPSSALTPHLLGETPRPEGPRGPHPGASATPAGRASARAAGEGD